ncbi:MAG: NAD(P)/FAD-dependent oxidoreductase [Bacteroidota bacterium]
MDQRKNQPNVYIIGAGVSGLVAALVLEKHGISPTILEATDEVGGRVKTAEKDGYLMDHGFQVLLDAYPKAKTYLDYDQLDLQPLLPGATIFSNGKSYSIGDPLRNAKFVWGTLFAPVGSLADKLKILKLNKQLKTKSLDHIFDAPEVTTRQYLSDFGFSEKMIAQFFRPFFAGIFLEPDLATSSRMFEFVFKMFGEGLAVIPKDGMQAIPNQLASQLKQTTIKFRHQVKNIQQQEITLDTDEKLTADFVIVTSGAEQLIPNYTSTLAWKSCDNLYFTTPTRTINEKIIGLNANENALINNVFYPTSIVPPTDGKQELLSVTIVREHDLTETQLIEAVQKELKEAFQIEHTTFIKRFEITKALPQLSDLQYEREASESVINEYVAIAGDHLLNGSLNAAMTSGEAAAMAAMAALNKRI